MKIILASSSLRRKMLLKSMGLKFECMIPQKEEDMTQKISIQKLSEKLSFQKAKEIFDVTYGDRLIIGSDCMVYYKNKKIGKPKDKNEAYKIISMLSGHWHKVVTGLCVIVQRKKQTKTYLTHEISKVKFKKLTDVAISEYLKTKNYIGKAGAYAIQGKFGMFVDKIKGNYSNIVGLPTNKLYDILKNENIMK